VGTLIQDMPQINPVSQPRWDRFERADLFEQYPSRQLAGGLSYFKPGFGTAVGEATRLPTVAN
jgi:hypothetical protein